jgi:hypothetical protein
LVESVDRGHIGFPTLKLELDFYQVTKKNGTAACSRSRLIGVLQRYEGPCGPLNRALISYSAGDAIAGPAGRGVSPRLQRPSV